MSSSNINLTDVAHKNALSNNSIQTVLVQQLLTNRVPMFTSLVYDRKANCVLFVLYYGPGSDYIYSNDLYTSEEAYQYVELIYDSLKAITNDQAFSLEREIRKFRYWSNLVRPKHAA